MFYHVYGFTEVICNAKHTIVSHSGNMRDTEDDVRKNFDTLYFKGAYDRISTHRFARKNGSPDYIFTLRIPNSVFENIIFKKSV